MSRYDGLIIPRSYSEYINKTDAATLQQALQLSGVLSGTVAAGDNKAVKSGAVYEKLVNGESWTKINNLTEIQYKLVGKTVFLHIASLNGVLMFESSGASMKIVSTGETIILPQSIKPRFEFITFNLQDNSYDTVFHGRITSKGEIKTWRNQYKQPEEVSSWQADVVYRID